MRGDDVGVELRHARCEPFLEALDLGRRLLDRSAEASLLVVGLLGASLVDQIEADRRLQQVGLAAAEAGRGGKAVQPRPPRPLRGALRAPGRLLVRLQALDRRDHPAPVVPALLLLAAQVLEQARLRDDATHLGGDRPQDADLVG